MLPIVLIGSLARKCLQEPSFRSGNTIEPMGLLHVQMRLYRAFSLTTPCCLHYHAFGSNATGLVPSFTS
jgi:hypothetical protein